MAGLGGPGRASYPSVCSGAARIGIGWHRETGDYPATVAALLNAAPSCRLLHAVARDVELFSSCDRAAGFGDRFAVRGDGVSGLEKRLAVLLDRYVEGARGRVFHGDGEARRHHRAGAGDRESTRLNSSHLGISY